MQQLIPQPFVVKPYLRSTNEFVTVVSFGVQVIIVCMSINLVILIELLIWLGEIHWMLWTLLFCK